MKKFLEILGIIAGLVIIIVELVRLFSGISYKYSDLSVSTQIIKEARDVVRESDVLNYVKAIELNTLIIEDSQNGRIYNIADYNIGIASTKPTKGLFTLNNSDVEEGIFKYEIENNTSYYACYNKGNVSISKTLYQLKDCDDLKETLKNLN